MEKAPILGSDRCCALVRGLACALVAGGLTAAFFTVIARPTNDAVPLTGLFALFGLLVGPLSMVERVAERRAPTVRRDLLAAAAVVGLGLVLAAAALVQVAFLFFLYDKGGDLGRTIDELTDWFGEKALRPRVLTLLAPAVAPMALVTLLRLRGAPLILQSATTASVSTGIALLAVLLSVRSSGQLSARILPVLGLVFVGTAALPLLYRLADAVEVRALGRDPTREPPPRA